MLFRVHCVWWVDVGIMDLARCFLLWDWNGNGKTGNKPIHVLPPAVDDGLGGEAVAAQGAPRGVRGRQFRPRHHHGRQRRVSYFVAFCLVLCVCVFFWVLA